MACRNRLLKPSSLTCETTLHTTSWTFVNMFLIIFAVVLRRPSARKIRQRALSIANKPKVKGFISALPLLCGLSTRTFWIWSHFTTRCTTSGPTFPILWPWRLFALLCFWNCQCGSPYGHGLEKYSLSCRICSPEKNCPILSRVCSCAQCAE